MRGDAVRLGLAALWLAAGGCLEAPPGGASDAAQTMVDGATAPDAAPTSDAATCGIAFRDDFQRELLGDGWSPLGDQVGTTAEIENEALVITATAEAEYAFGAVRSALAWDMAGAVIEANLTPGPSTDGDTFFGWIEENGNRYIGLTAIDGARVSIVVGTLAGSWVEPCAPSCPAFEEGGQRWRIRPDGDVLVFEVAQTADAWQVVEPRPAPQFSRGHVGLWAETDVGLTSSMVARQVTVSTCD